MRRSPVCEPTGVRAPVPVVVLACLLLAGCGGDGGGAATTSTDTAAADVDVTQLSQAEIDRRNARALPTTSTAATVPSPAPEPAAPKLRKPRRVHAIRLLTGADRASFDRLAATLGGSSGIAVKRAGRGGATVFAGSLKTGAAWSTMKTGVAAAIYAGTVPSGGDTLLRRAITASDNDAAEQLWSALGPPEQAGARVHDALVAAGDATARSPGGVAGVSSRTCSA